MPDGKEGALRLRLAASPETQTGRAVPSVATPRGPERAWSSLILGRGGGMVKRAGACFGQNPRTPRGPRGRHGNAAVHATPQRRRTIDGVPLAPFDPGPHMTDAAPPAESLPQVRLTIARRSSHPWVFRKMVEKPATRLP